MRAEAEPLVQFTDEELLLLGAQHPVVDSPYLNTLPPQQRELAAQVAYRSLCSHGAVAVDGGAGMELPESYVTLLQLRAAADSALVVSKATPERGVMRYHHLGGDTVVLEDVSDAGAHEFRLIPRTSVAESLRLFCHVDGAADGHGGPVTLTQASFVDGEAATELWGTGLAQFDATVWRRRPDTAEPAPLLGFLLGSRGSWGVQRGQAIGDAATVRLTPLPADAVGDTILTGLLDGEGSAPAPPECHLMGA